MKCGQRAVEEGEEMTTEDRMREIVREKLELEEAQAGLEGRTKRHLARMLDAALDGLARGEVDATASHTLRSRLASPKDELTLGKAWLAGFRAATTVAQDWVMGRRK